MGKSMFSDIDTSEVEVDEVKSKPVNKKSNKLKTFSLKKEKEKTVKPKVSKQKRPKFSEVFSNSEDIKIIKVYSYFAREVFTPGEVPPMSGYTLRSFRAVERRNVSGIIALKRSDSIMKDIEDVINNIETGSDTIDYTISNDEGGIIFV